ncbi:MAG: hypothetical protein JSU92_11865 [Deltaproteobacteria bacterium]|nr:MAG: hypothetical protein JSU92_11865 [Deltaproteobacteria bacterium]
MKKLLFPILTVALTLALASPALAQREKAKRKEKMERMEKIEKQKCSRMCEELKLSKEDSSKFCSLMREHRKQKKELGKAIVELVDKLEVELEKKNTEQMKALVEEIEAKFDERIKLDQTLKSDLKQMLSVEQQAIFIIHSPKIDRKVKSMMWEKKSGKKCPNCPNCKPPCPSTPE